MKIAIIGSTSLRYRMQLHKEYLENRRHEVRMPVFDDFGSVTDVVRENIARIQWADEVHGFWDGHSDGFLIDFGAAVALKKTFKDMYPQRKTIDDVLKAFGSK